MQLGRITKNKEFDHIFKNGKVSYNNLMGIRMVANGLDEVRLGILVNTKVSKKAVERNKIRRRLREIFRLMLANIKEKQDFVVIALPEIKNKEYKDIEAAVEFNLKRLRALK